ncbi:SDR family oxidoreductase [Pseudoalteromonas sp. SSM20]|uniref:SDR family oxidoreductase n=1 Tax=Pseudoalteromonas TaxID=53246 RepID=UPI0037370EA9
MSQIKKLCLLTGASGGIGEAIAKTLAARGYTLVISGRDLSKLNHLKNALPGEHFYQLADLSDSASRSNLMAFVKSLGKLDLLINCAGLSLFKPFTDTQLDEIERLLKLNVTAAMALSQEALIEAGEHPLTIINVGSALGAIGHPGYVAYCTSKFALRGFSEALGREYANSNKQIKYLAPRATNTAINSNEVVQMNKLLGNQMDEPEVVASALIALLDSSAKRKTLGWPEKLFVRLNGAFPELVDNALARKVKKIKSFFTQSLKEA